MFLQLLETDVVAITDNPMLNNVAARLKRRIGDLRGRFENNLTLLANVQFGMRRLCDARKTQQAQRNASVINATRTIFMIFLLG